MTLDLVLLLATIGLTLITLLYGVACQVLMEGDSTRDRNVAA